jgi:hypothetical protein
MNARTRAIVEAAERLAKEIDLSLAPYGYARYILNAGGTMPKAAESALCDLARALALPAEPAPAWTRTPPSEPGWYFASWGGAPAGIVRVGRGYDEDDPALHVWTTGDDLCESLSGLEGVEWWPVPIQIPEEK